MPLGKMEINRGLLEIAMAEEDLNGAQIGACLQEMRGEAVAQGILVLLMI